MNVPAKVARIKRRIQRHVEPTPVTSWRRNVRYLAKWMLLCIAAMFLAAAVVVLGVRHA